MQSYQGRALYGQRPSRRNTTPTEPESTGNDVDEAEELEARERYAEGWAEAHADDADGGEL